jgi:3-oxoacyl-[acyl-carrier protein] reductase
VATNVKSTLFLSQAAARQMPPGSVIINLSSIGTRLAAPITVVYTATKAAVEMMTLSMARALGPRRIRVVAVAPGLTDTEMLRSVLSPQVLADAPSRNMLGRLGQTSDIAPVIAFLASDDAGWITGETIHVNGGQRG